MELNEARKMGLDIYSHVTWIKQNTHQSNYPLWAQRKTWFCCLLDLTSVPHKSSDWMYPNWSVWFKPFKKSITFLNFILSGSFTLHLLKKRNQTRKPNNNNKTPENQPQTLLGFILCWWLISLFSFSPRYRALWQGRLEIWWTES